VKRDTLPALVHRANDATRTGSWRQKKGSHRCKP